MLRPGGYTKKLHMLIADRQTGEERRETKEMEGNKGKSGEDGGK